MYWATLRILPARARAQLGKLEALGWTMYTGIEPEFMLLERRPDGTLVPFDATDTLDKPCYDYKGLARGSDFSGGW
jgi:glutamine synthetase